MKLKLKIIALFAMLFATQIQAQDVTTVRANNSDISDNLDLKAVASIFGDSQDLADFERRLNDPKIQISNLDLNGDNQVDYLRVIETVESNTHLIIIQSVLEKDVFQDVATVEVERDSNNNVQVQVVGDVYMYGSNYIYEPLYVHVPVIYNVFWMHSYRPYYSPYYYSYYPSYYSPWNVYPVYAYRRNVHVHINVNNHYNYVTNRRSSRAESMYRSNRADGYARKYPERSFAQRNNNVTNRQEFVQSRNQNGSTRANRSAITRATVNSRNTAVKPTRTSASTRATETRANGSTRTQTSTRAVNNSGRMNTNASSTRAQGTTPTRATSTERATPSRVQSQAPMRSQTPAPTQSRAQAPVQTRAQAPVQTRAQAPVQSQPRMQSAPQQSQRSSGGEARGNSGGGRR